jgi:hypothetical protein
MSLQTDAIRTILEKEGLIKFTRSTTDLSLIDRGIIDEVVENNYSKYDLTVIPDDKIISMMRVANGTSTYNAINIQTIDVKATVGTISTPGYVYTGDFSGCVFYLYKLQSGEVSGVHAYSGMQRVTKPGWLWGTTSKMEVREFGPTDYFKRNPAREICRYPTRLEMDLSTGEKSLAFLSCVENTSATTFLFSTKGTSEGARVVRMLREYPAVNF